MMDGLFAPDMLPVSSVPPSKVRTRAKIRSGKPAARSAEWPLDGAINVVLFAGMGGACQGLEEAGLPIHIACNHDEVAIAAHKALNPHTKHVTGDLFDVDPVAATGGRRVKVLWASPDCKDHSSAKGGAPRSPRVRSLPWQVCRWAAKTKPDVIAMENVREIRGWGPLIAKRDKKTGRVLKLDGTVAAPGERVPVQEQQLVRDTRRLGKTFRRWRRHLEALGYAYEDRDLCCADYGVPTSRRRWFAVGRRDGMPIRWPERTHASRKELERLNVDRAAQGLPNLLPHRAAAEIIDWSLPMRSIFDRDKELAPATQKRIAVGYDRFVGKAKKPFLVHLTHGGRLHDTIDPAPTMTTAHRGEMAVVGPALVPTTHTKSGARVHDGLAPTPTLTAGVKGGEFAAMAATIVGAGGRAAQVPPMDVADGLNTSTTKEDRCVVAATLVGVAHGDDARSGSRAYDIEDALRTATGSNDQAVIAAHVTTFRNGSVGHGMDEPTRTFTTQQSDHHPGGAPSFGVVAAHLTRYHGERHPGEKRGVDPAVSLPTATTENRFGIVGATLAPAIMSNNANNVGASMKDGVPTVTTGNRNFVVAGHLEKFNENSRGQSASEPIDTLMAGAPRFGVVGAFLEEAHGNSAGRDAAEPTPTQTQVPHHSVIGAHLIQTGYGEREGQAPRALDIEDPIGTQVAGGGKHAVVGAWMVKHYGGRTGSEADGALHTITTEGHHAVGAAWMVQHNTGVIGHSADEPVSAMTTAVTQQQVAAAYLTEFRGTSADGQPVSDPAGSICTGGGRGGGHDGVTAAYLSEYYGTGGQHQGCDDALNTLTTNDRFAVTGAGMRLPPIPPEKLARARQVAAFLRQHGVWDDREFVTLIIEGIAWIVVDICMRMLTPAEAAAAHELRMPELVRVPKRDRKGFVITGEDGNIVYVDRPLTKTEAMRLVGNSVPKRMAMLLAEANAVHALSAPSLAAE